MSMLNQKAPDFTLPNASGTLVTLSDVYAKGPVVVYFYPKDETPGCTAEACAFRDAYEDFKSAGAEVIGISADNGASHVKFAGKHRLPFILLSDEGDKVAKQYGIKSVAFGLIKGRETFVLDQKGLIRQHFVSAVRMAAHVTEAIRTIKGLDQSPQPRV